MTVYLLGKSSVFAATEEEKWYCERLDFDAACEELSRLV